MAGQLTGWVSSGRRTAPFRELVDTETWVDVPAARAKLAAARGVVLVLAPAGWGKTTALTAWELEDGRPFRWAALAEAPGGSDPVRSLTDALSDLPPQEGRPGPPLATLLDRMVGPCVLVVDGIERLAGDAGGRVLEELVERAAPDVLLVLAGRSADPAVLTRIRASRRCTTITPADLAVRPSDVATLVGARLPHELAERLHSRTGGWPVALHLSAAAATEGIDVTTLAGDDAVLSRYVRTVLLEGLDPAQVELMSWLSLLESAGGPLADAVCLRTGSQDDLERLAEGHLLLHPADDDPSRFRQHPLVRACLAADLQRRDPELVREVRERAAGWYVEHGEPRSAVEQLLAAGRTSAALDLLDEVLLPMFHEGELPQLIEWIGRIGDDHSHLDGFQATLLGFAAMMSGDRVCTDRWLDVAARGYAAGGAEAPSSAPYLVLRAHRCPDGVSGMLGDTSRLVDVMPDSSGWLAPSLLVHGTALHLTDQLDAAERVLERAVHVGLGTGAYPASAFALGQRSLIAHVRRDAAATRRHAEESARLIEAHGLGDYPLAGITYAVLARLAAARDDRGAARRLYTQAERVRPVTTDALPWAAVQMRVEMARAATLLGEQGAATILLRETASLVAAIPGPGRLETELAAAQRAVGGLVPTAGRLLTGAELRILSMLPSHLSIEEIGEELFLSRNTVKTHVGAIYRKLGAANRSEAVAQARRVGLIDS